MVAAAAPGESGPSCLRRALSASKSAAELAAPMPSLNNTSCAIVRCAGEDLVICELRGM